MFGITVRASSGIEIRVSVGWTVREKKEKEKRKKWNMLKCVACGASLLKPRAEPPGPGPAASVLHRVVAFLPLLPACPSLESKLNQSAIHLNYTHTYYIHTNASIYACIYFHGYNVNGVMDKRALKKDAGAGAPPGRALWIETRTFPDIKMKV